MRAGHEKDSCENRWDWRIVRPMGAYSPKTRKFKKGFTLFELIIASSLLLILASAALPVVRFTIVRQREAELHRALREIRDALKK